MGQKEWRVLVALKQAGKPQKKVALRPFYLKNRVHTLESLIEEMVHICLFEWRSSQENTPTPLSDEQWESMQEVGKFAFGVHYNEREVDEVKAIARAKEAVQDGIVRIFLGDQELGLSQKIELCEDDVLTFVRLTMLTGRLW